MAPPRSKKPVLLADLGPPPSDTLEANEWAFRALAHSMYQAMTDGSLTEVDRRKEVREIAGTMRGLIPQTRLRQAEGSVIGEQHEIAHGNGPELEDASQFSPGSSRPKAKRGRPRKRSVL